MNISIIGGGIGGLTTALALKQNGLAVSVFEGAQEIKPVGAGIIIAINAMQVFDKLGIRNKIEQAGHRISIIKITDEQLNVLSQTDLSNFEKKYKVNNVAIHRADLQNILAVETGFENIQLSKRLSAIDEGDGYKLNFEDGTTIYSDVVIGADGINSVVRKQLFHHATIRDTRQRCWRGVTRHNFGDKYNHVATEALGKGKRIGFTKINSDYIYWYAVINEGLINKNLSVPEMFKEFHPDLLRLIEDTPEEKIFFSDISDLKPIKQWHRGRACLVGDAAHATTPNMGQGACQAIEDAYILGKLFESGKSLEEIFTQYEKLRIKKAHFIVNTSMRLGKLAHLENPFAILLRNLMIKTLSKNSNKQLERVFEIY